MKALLLFSIFVSTSVLNAQLWVRNFILPTLAPNFIESSVEWKGNIYACQNEVNCVVATNSRLLKLDSEGNILSTTYGLYTNLLVLNDELFGIRNSFELVKIDEDLKVIDSLMFNGLYGNLKKITTGFEILTLNSANIFQLIKVNTLNQMYIESSIDFPLSSIQLINPNFNSNAYGDMYYFNDNHKYWFFSANGSVLLDSTLNPLKVTMNPNAFSGTAYLHYNSLRSFQLNSGSILTISSLQKVSNTTSYYFRVRKWGHEDNVIDSIDLTHIVLADTQFTLAQKASLTQPLNGVFYAAATSNHFLPHSKVVLAKMDTSLNLFWTKTFEHPNRNIAMYHITSTNDGGALISGTTFNWVTKDDHSGYLIRIDSTGAILTTNDPLMRVEKDFIVYPNPAKNDLYFSAQHESKPIDIQIFDALGTLVYQEINAQQTQLSLEGWSKGIYVYRVRCENRVTSGKVVKE